MVFSLFFLYFILTIIPNYRIYLQSRGCVEHNHILSIIPYLLECETGLCNTTTIRHPKTPLGDVTP